MREGILEVLEHVNKLQRSTWYVILEGGMYFKQDNAIIFLIYLNIRPGELYNNL